MAHERVPAPEDDHVSDPEAGGGISQHGDRRGMSPRDSDHTQHAVETEAAGLFLDVPGAVAIGLPEKNW